MVLEKALINAIPDRIDSTVEIVLAVVK